MEKRIWFDITSSFLKTQPSLLAKNVQIRNPEMFQMCDNNYSDSLVTR